MLVKLFGNGKMYKIYLPEEVEGNYWIYDNSNDEENKLVNIRGINGKWVLVSSKFSKIINEQYIKKNTNNFQIIPSENTIIKLTELTDYKEVTLSVKDSDDLYCLYCFPTYEEHVKTYKFRSNKEITIGSDIHNDIVVNNLLVKDKHARIFMKNGRWHIENYDVNIGTFINNNFIEEDVSTVIRNGDLISICGFRLIILGNQLSIMGKKYIVGNGLIECKVNYILKNEIKIEDNSDENIDLYNEQDYFYSSPRIIEKDVEETISIDPPPKQENIDNFSQFISLISSFGVVLTTGVSLIIAVFTMQSNGISIITRLVTSICMMFTAIVIPIIRIVLQRKMKRKVEKNRQYLYT